MAQSPGHGTMLGRVTASVKLLPFPSGAQRRKELGQDEGWVVEGRGVGGWS